MKDIIQLTKKEAREMLAVHYASPAPLVKEEMLESAIIEKIVDAWELQGYIKPSSKEEVTDYVNVELSSIRVHNITAEYYEDILKHIKQKIEAIQEVE